MVSGLIQSGKVSLTHWCPYAVAHAVQAQSHQRRYSRWLNNPHIDIFSAYAPLVRQWLSHLPPQRLYLAIDTTEFGRSFCQARVSVLVKGRGIPLVWKTFKQSSSSVSFANYRPLLDQLQEILPPHCPILLLGDRGFGHLELMEYCQSHHWHCLLRLKGNHSIGRGPLYLQARHLLSETKQGHAKFFHNIRFTQKRRGPLHVALARPQNTKELWALLCDEKTSMKNFQTYALRMGIEANFLDDKSNGFQWQNTRLFVPEALDRLTLVMATASLYLTLQGIRVVQWKKRSWVDPHGKRGLSFFKIGWQ